jgi:hypothetical protein
MTTTYQVYGTASLVLLPLMGAVCVPVLSFLSYRWVKRHMTQQDTTNSRGYYFYRALSGVLLGQLLGHMFVVPLTNMDAVFAYAFVLVGYILLEMLDGIGRMWNTNDNYTGVHDDAVQEDLMLDKDHVEEKEVVHISNVTSAEFAESQWAMEDWAKDNRKRHWLLAALMTVFGITVTIQGMLVVYRGGWNNVAVIFCYYVNGIMLSIGVFAAMTHSKIHLDENRRKARFWWCLLTFIWAALAILSSVPTLANISITSASIVLQNRVFLCFVGVTSGVMLRLQFYYHSRRLIDATWQSTLLGLLVLTVTATASFVTGFWL